MLLGNHLNFDKNEAQNIVIHNLSTFPTNPKNGMLVYLTQSGQQGLYLRKEGNWINLGTVEALTNGGINITPISGIQYLSVKVDGSTIVINGSGNLEVKENGIGIRELNTTAIRITDFADPNKNLSLANFKIVNLGDPTNNTDAVNKQYVDTQIASQIAAMGDFIGDWAGPGYPTVGSGTAGAIVKGDWWRISSGFTLGTVVLEVGDALFAKTNNPGTTATNWFSLQNNVGEATSTALGLVRVSTSADLTAVNGTNTTHVVRIADLLARVSTTTRTGLIRLATQSEVNSGTNNDTAVTPLTMVTYVNTLVGSRGFVSPIGNGTATSIVVTHNLGSKNIIAQVVLNSADEDVIITDIKKPAINTIAIDFSVAPAANSYKVQVLRVD